MKCPTCKNESKLQTRIKRSFLIKILPKSKAYKCYHCETKYFRFLFLNIPYNIKRNYNIKKETPIRK